MPANPLALSAAQIDLFINDGFVRIDNAFPRAVADAARSILWADHCAYSPTEMGIPTGPMPHPHQIPGTKP